MYPQVNFILNTSNEKLLALLLLIPSFSWSEDNLDGTYLFCDNPKYNHMAWQTGYEFKGKSKDNKDYPDENYLMHHDLIQYNISLILMEI